jgi:hypothetical protein
MVSYWRPFLFSTATYAVLVAVAGLYSPANAQEPVSDTGFRPVDAASEQEKAELPKQLRELLFGCTPLNPNKTVLLEVKKKRVFLQTEVVCRNCVLEMLCVPRGQREHETILNVDSKAATVHAALLAIGLKRGEPAVFFPDFRPPQGTRLTLKVHWVDEDGRKQTADARSWVRHSIFRYFSQPLDQAPPGVELPHDELRYDRVNKQLIWYGPMSTKQKAHLLTLWDNSAYQTAIGEFFDQSQSRPMTAEFIFAGSIWQKIEGTQRRVYAAEDGHFITVANFATSTIDIAEPSSASDGGQLYEAWEERIPPEGTPVLLEILPAEVEEETAADSAIESKSP